MIEYVVEAKVHKIDSVRILLLWTKLPSMKIITLIKEATQVHWFMTRRFHSFSFINILVFSKSNRRNGMRKMVKIMGM